MFEERSEIFWRSGDVVYTKTTGLLNVHYYGVVSMVTRKKTGNKRIRIYVDFGSLIMDCDPSSFNKIDDEKEISQIRKLIKR